MTQENLESPQTERPIRSPESLRALQYGCIASVLALIALGIAWEGAIAPLRPGGSWLILKVLPLLLPLRGLLRSDRRSFQWTSFLVLAYFIEGAVRAWTDRGASQTMAFIEIVLSLIAFYCAIYAAQAMGPRRLSRAERRKAKA